MFNPSRDILIGFLLVCAAAWGLMGTRVLRFADQALYDAQAGWLRINAASDRCAATCPQVASLHLLQARAALAGKRPQEAFAEADAALKLLRDRDEAVETGNAWRVIAAARLAGGDAAGALPAAEAALDIDRRLALPEKIARDWLLIGDIRQKIGAGDTAAAYRRALDVANASGLTEIARSATQSLAKFNSAKDTLQ